MKKFKIVALAALFVMFVMFVGVSMGLGMAEIWFYFGGKPL
tara:strand:- start:403 stop:525 length:123 start_codon:yes stop_codon:yes gene_type:complete